MSRHVRKQWLVTPFCILIGNVAGYWACSLGKPFHWLVLIGHKGCHSSYELWLSKWAGFCTFANVKIVHLKLGVFFDRRFIVYIWTGSWKCCLQIWLNLFEEWLNGTIIIATWMMRSKKKEKNPQVCLFKVKKRAWATLEVLKLL